MAVSSVLISNLALSHIGAGQIQALDEASAEAIQANLWYDPARKQLLEAYNWSFARKRATLAEHGDAAPDGVWGYRYQYPVDCLKARQLVNLYTSSIAATTVFGSRPQDIWDSGDMVPFEIEISDDGTKSIVTNLEDASLIYTFDQDDASMFPWPFIDAFTYLLAGRMAYPLVGKRSIAQDMFAAYREVVRAAAAIDANEGVPDQPREAEWIRKR